MQANDAMRIFSSAAAMGLLGGGSALAYNATTKPILDEYGNVIESNDINPVMAALGSAAIGAVGSGIYGKMNQPVARPVQGMSAGKSSQPRQSPDIVEPEVTPTQKMPRQDAEYPYETYWEQSSPNERTPGDTWDDIANAVDEVTDPEKVAQRNAQYEAEFARKQQAAYQESKQKQALQQERIDRQQSAIDYMEGEGYNTEYGEYRGLVKNRFGQLVKPEKPVNNANYGVKGWDYIEPNLAIVKVVPVSPMQMQNPMTRPGMRTVVIQPMKEPGQEMIEEALRLKELARQQGNPSVPYDVFGEADGYWEAQKKRA